jgi:hypothetical protein
MAVSVRTIPGKEVATMGPAASVNLAVTIIILLASLGSLFIFWTKYSLRRPSTFYAFCCWCTWWLSLMVAYLLIVRFPGTQSLVLATLDVGSLALLGFAIVYCHGDEAFTGEGLAVSLKAVVPVVLSITFLALVAYYILLWLLTNWSPVLASIWRFSPSAVLSNVGLVMFGWVMFVRWGMKALLLFLGTLAYALAQTPGYIELFLLIPQGWMQGVGTPGPLFYGLAAGKVFIAAYSLVLFLSPIEHSPDTKKAKYWPKPVESFYFHPRVRKVLLWVLTPIWVAFAGTLVLWAATRYSTQPAMGLFEANLAEGLDIGGRWQYKCKALDREYSHGGDGTIEIRSTAYGPQWQLAGTRRWKELNGNREDNLNYSWSTDWAAVTERDRIKYTYRVSTNRGVVIGFADGAITERRNGRPVRIDGNFYQLPPFDPMYGVYEFTRD